MSIKLASFFDLQWWNQVGSIAGKARLSHMSLVVGRQKKQGDIRESDLLKSLLKRGESLFD